MNYKINNIYNEDSYEAIKKIPNKSIDCIYVDVPYLYRSTSENITGKSAISKRISKIQNTELIDIRDGFDYSLLDDFIRIMKKMELIKTIIILLLLISILVINIITYISIKSIVNDPSIPHFIELMVKL